MFVDFKPQEIEPEILSYWKSKKVVEKLRAKNKEGPRFYFLEGPPYTSGRIHLGTAWNMALKDVVLRYKRARGFKVWDRMGYDMHGLPTEQKVMAKLNLKNKEDIEKFGVKKFTAECEQFCTEMMKNMNEDFIRLGSTLDFSNPYQPITKKFMEAEWWLIKQAQQKERLYQGLRTMHWDAATQTAVAKHELEYKTITDTSIYVKFPHSTRNKTFFIIWTTTPWTIPLNLALMVNPTLGYAEVSVQGETWIMAKELVSAVMKKVGFDVYKQTKEYKGKVLEGQGYLHPLDVKNYLPAELQKNKRLCTILLSEEYVTATDGTGIVHCAPGCGPEDYEVGHHYHIPPFNCVNEAGLFDNFGPFSGWKAKADDQKFIQAIDEAGLLLFKEAYTHEYPHGERSHHPVIFRTTKQWFFKVEDLKEKMLAANAKIYWHPQSGKNAFTSWLEHLRDNSITKQRYWGTPVPIWQHEEGDYLVMGSVKELEKLSGKKVTQMHIPVIDKITIVQNGKTYRRVPDVLDVWIDAGTASWNCLDYPSTKKHFEEWFPADFILEGKDQIRGWFNLLMVASFLALDKPAFKAVYMHGFLNDTDGVKMSKSLGNIISPQELLEKHGTDVLRYYMSQTTAGEDINFSWEECGVKGRYLQILWNVHKLLLNLAEENKCNPFTLKATLMQNILGKEEQYIFSKLYSTIKKVTELLDAYHIDEAIAPLEELYLELSRTYIQLVRDKSALGEEEEKEVCMYTIAIVLLDLLKMFQAVAPFISEAIYLNLREKFQLKEVSISHYPWPMYQKDMIRVELEEQVMLMQEIVAAALAAREKAKLGLRWPVQEVVIETTNKEAVAAAEQLRDILKKQTNAKDIAIVERLPAVKVKVKPDYGKIGPAYGPLSPQIIMRLTIDSPETIMGHLDTENEHTFKIEGKTIRITRNMLLVERIIPEPYIGYESKVGMVYINTTRTPALEAEGYAREVMRQVQSLRKKAGLQKLDRIVLLVKVSEAMKRGLEKHKAEIEEKVGASKMEISLLSPVRRHQHTEEFSIKQEKFSVWLDKV